MYFFSFFSKTLLLFSDAYDFNEILKTATFPTFYFSSFRKTGFSETLFSDT